LLDGDFLFGVPDAVNRIHRAIDGDNTSIQRSTADQLAFVGIWPHGVSSRALDHMDVLVHRIVGP